jgi:hypothetical protein
LSCLEALMLWGRNRLKERFWSEKSGNRLTKKEFLIRK